MKCLCEKSVVTRERREKVQSHGSKERERESRRECRQEVQIQQAGNRKKVEEWQKTDRKRAVRGVLRNGGSSRLFVARLQPCGCHVSPLPANRTRPLAHKLGSIGRVQDGRGSVIGGCVRQGSRAVSRPWVRPAAICMRQDILSLAGGCRLRRGGWNAAAHCTEFKLWLCPPDAGRCNA